jgi:Bacteriophage lambda head decoration protein D
MVITQMVGPAEFVMKEETHNFSRESVTFSQSQAIVPGQIVGAAAVVASETSSIIIGVNAGTGAANTGNGVATLANPATSQGAIDGDYILTCTAAAANAGTFSVQTPDGREIGPLTVGVAFNKEIKLTIADGSADFVVGDSFVVRVGITYPDDYLFAGLNPAATDGTQKAVGISVYRVVTTPGSTVKSPIVVRNALVAGKSLTWPAGITAAQQAEATEQLRKLGIVIR